jgi:peptidoglycan/xylan/chitin deacetylase (PgdA/CDA1 family)
LIPVLMYHDIRPDDWDLSLGAPDNTPYIQRISQFNDQINYLLQHNFITLRTSDLQQFLEGNAPSDFQGQSRAVILTFDDGDISNYETAFRLLSKNGQKATFFITTDFVGRSGYVSWSQLLEMHSAGMEIGSHSVSHAVPSKLNATELWDELAKSKGILQERIGAPVISFSLPTGFHNSKVESFAREAGYSFVCNSRAGYLNTRSLQSFNIRRIAIKRTTSLKEFIHYINCDSLIMIKKRFREELKGRIKGMLGVSLYNQMRRHVIRRVAK